MQRSWTSRHRFRSLRHVRRDKFGGSLRGGFTLIEMLVVVAIISLLISILMPSLSRARDQAKGVHCLARMKEFGNAIAAYEGSSGDILPPAEWYPDPNSTTLRYGWAEVLWRYIYHDPVFDPNRPINDPDHEPAGFPVQRNVEGDRWEEYVLCKASSFREPNSGHYRVYLPAWSASGYHLRPDGTYDDSIRPDPQAAVSRSSIRPKLLLLGDASEQSARGDGLGTDDCSYIDAGEANIAGVNGDGNRFSDRHYGGTNFLFQDLHASWEISLRQKLAVDYDLNGINDVTVAP